MKCDKLLIYNNYIIIIDIVIAFLFLMTILPVMILVGIILKMENIKEPIIFQQRRIGRNGNIFIIYKFNTLPREFPQVPTKYIDLMQPTVKRFAVFLRQTRINELPQLINIIKGEMRFVGPRPLILQDSDVLNYRRNTLLWHLYPGLTFIDRIKGGETLSLQERETLELSYLKVKSLTRCFIQDLQIVISSIIISVLSVLKSIRYEKN